MSERKADTPVVVADAAAIEESPTRAALQRQMDEAREDISETVAEIKEVVAHQYDGVRDGLNEVLDWREHFTENPVVWGAGAVSVGILIGIGLSHAFEDTTSAKRRRRRTEISSLGEHLIGEVSGLADAVLPALTGKVKEMFGVDLAAYLPGASDDKPARKHAATKRVAGKKKTAGKKSAAKKRAARKKSDE
ncbi:MAG TPA: hypothetical protein VM934_11375 [Pyrinomonadaceae bacterium]|jgi:hypothetical protein|nr:hypothetical protein [Pyrinomonadaceae bacterium]